MLIVGILILFISLLYALMIVYFIRSWNAIPPVASEFYDTVSILIAARNEEDHVLECLNSCLTQTGLVKEPEVIVVDDQSEDDTYDLLKSVEHPRLKVMRLGVQRMTTIQGSKKKAISYGVHHADGNIILSTDADCKVPEEWCKQLLSCFEQSRIHLVSAPVCIAQPRNLLEYFQALDFTANGLINAAGIHANTHFLCNAANLAYRKQSFIDGNVYEHQQDIASGDDVFLVEKIRQRHPQGIVFLKNKQAIVTTRAESSWVGLLRQRLRWASKLKWVKTNSVKWISAFVWCQRVSIPFGLLCAAWAKSELLWGMTLMSLLIQFIADFQLQRKANHFFETPQWKKWFLPVWLIHPFYFLLVGLLSALPLSLEWKGRPI